MLVTFHIPATCVCTQRIHTHTYTLRHIRIYKPFLCYLKDAALWPKRFVSSFAGTLKLHSLQLEKMAHPLNNFLLWKCKTHFCSWHLGTDIRDTCIFWRGAGVWMGGMSVNWMCKHFWEVRGRVGVVEMSVPYCCNDVNQSVCHL